jgi:hypothetical protein
MNPRPAVCTRGKACDGNAEVADEGKHEHEISLS